MKKHLLFFLIPILLLFLGFYYFSRETTTPLQSEEDVVLTVDGKKITERDIEHYIREVSRDNFGENLSLEEIRSEAIDIAIMFKVVEKYYDKKNIYVSEEEIENEIKSYIAGQPGIETREDFFRLVEMRGYSREEFLRNTEYFLKNRKLAQIIAADIDVSEEEALERYTTLIEESENKELFPEFEEIKNIIKDEVAFNRAIEIITEEINAKEEQTSIVFLK